MEWSDWRWDVKEPLRMTKCLAVTTLGVPIHLKYIILHIHAGHHGAVTVACNCGLKDLGCRSQLPQCGAVSLGKTLHLYVHSLNPGVNRHLVGQWLLVCLNSYQCHDCSRAVCSPGSWVGTGMKRFYNQGNLMWSAYNIVRCKYTQYNTWHSYMW